MERNKAMEATPDVTETNNDIRDNLNSSLTALTLNEQNTEINKNNETEEPEASSIPTKPITIPIRSLPVRNVPEKIILCLDTGVDSEYTSFKLGDGTTYAPLYMLKRVTEIFVHNKNFIDQRHEYALITLDAKGVKWIKELTNNPNTIVSGLYSKDFTECEVNEDFDISCVLNAVWENITIPKPMDPLHLPPPYVVRLIILYSRSYCSFNNKQNYVELLSNPYFTVDVIFTHEPNLSGKCQQIFNSLQKLDDKIYSYKFEVGRNVTMLHDCMAKLLAHPLQRPVQSLTSYEINQDTQTHSEKVPKEE